MKELEALTKKQEDESERLRHQVSKLEGECERHRTHSHQLREYKSKMEMLREENISLLERLELQEARHQKEVSAIERKIELERMERVLRKA